MEGSESPEGSSNNANPNPNHRNSYLGVNKLHSSKISKVVKRSVVQPPKHQAPVYTIDKNDFRNIVQRLTGSPAEPMAAAPLPPPPPPPASSAPAPNPALPRLHRIKPPPLQSVFSFNKLVSNPTLAAMNPSYYQQQQQQHVAVSRPMPLAAFQFPYSSGPSSQFYSSLPPLARSSTAWANVAPSAPRPAVPRMTASSGFATPFQLLQHNSAATAQQQAALLGVVAAAPLSPLFLANTQQVSPLPSPGSQFALSQLLGSGSQVPFSPGSLFPRSPTTAQSQSPGSLFPLSPAAHFPFSSL